MKAREMEGQRGRHQFGWGKTMTVGNYPIFYFTINKVGVWSASQFLLHGLQDKVLENVA